MAPIKESIKQRNKAFEGGIHTRGQTKAERKTKQDKSKPAISPTLVGLLIFIICGSAVIGLLQTLLSSYLTPEPSFEVTPEMMEQYKMQQAAQEQQAGFGSLSDYPLSDVYANDGQAPVQTEEEVVHLDDNEVENE